ncbi:lipoprotein LpqH [Arthrobacter sp. SLBN-53]|uniref:lipoprotein LpqH n=1 Tax=Arthrobacter sp. SLBN-53 TaxID=2768412 RepID=UPI001166633F|nr:lipoprotein LpqH [Arthrobacter sp. SLBN-53]TQK30274.1 lipoprotein LpqH [Arthrobacter sp. SLBN-53]
MPVPTLFVILATAIAGTLSGCGQPARPETVPTAASAPPPPPVQIDSVPAGTAQVVVNGAPGPTGPVQCDDDAGPLTISIGESSLGVTVIIDEPDDEPDDEAGRDAPTVRSVTIGDVGGVALAYAFGVAVPATAGRAPTVLRNDATWIVTGSGSGTDSADPARIVDSSYRIAVACP